jgi:hypothetical protein
MLLRVLTRVEGGRVRIDEPYDAPDGTEVEVIVDGDDLTAEDRALLHAELAAALAETDRGEGVSADQVIAELRALGKQLR